MVEQKANSLFLDDIRIMGHPTFETFDPFRPRASAIVHGAMLSLILFLISVLAIRYSYVHGMYFGIPRIAVNASSVPRTPAAPVRDHRVTVWLDPFVGNYISSRPPAKISIRVENDLLTGNHLTLSLSDARHSSVALSPVSPTKFVIVGAEDSYVDFTADARGRVCCLAFVVNGKAVAAQRR